MLFSLLVLKMGILIHKTGSYLQINNHWQFARYLDTIHTIYDLDSFFFFWKKRRGEYPLCMDYENDMKSNILLFVNVQALMCLILDGIFVEFFDHYISSSFDLSIATFGLTNIVGASLFVFIISYQ